MRTALQPHAPASTRPTSASSPASRSSQSKLTKSAFRAAPKTTPSAASTPRFSPTRHTAWQPAPTVTGLTRQVWRAMNAHQGLAVVDGTVAPRTTNFNFGAVPPFQLQGLLRRGQALQAGARRPSATRRPAGTSQLTVIGVLSDTAPLEMAGISTSQHTLAGTFGRTRPAHRLPVRAPPRRRPGRHRQSSSSRPSSPTACRPTRCQDAARRRRCRLAHVRSSDHGVHGARPDRRRHRPGRHQRPLRRRTPPADRRPARDRLPPPHGAVELPARVLVHRAHLDRARHRARPRRRLQRHPRLAATTELEQPQLRPTVADAGA